MNEYIFPFHTCETPNKSGVAQPFSAIVNMMNCLVILFFLFKTKSYRNFILLFSIFVFEAFHVFSHSIHINGAIQISITHALSYCINAAFLYFFYDYTNIAPTAYFIMYYLLLIGLDIYAFTNWNVVFYILTQALLFLSVLFYYYQYLPKDIKTNIFTILVLIIAIILLFINEKYNCKQMLHIVPFPFHIIIEIIGLLLFYIICKGFYKL